MKTLHVKIRGIAPFLMNRRPMEEEEKVKKKGQTIDHKEDAEKKSHFDKEIGYFIPGDMVEATIREAAKEVKRGRGSYKKTILSSVFCEQARIPLNRHDYDEIDKRFGTHPSTGNGILVSRVRFNKWEAEFDLTYNENKIDEKTLRVILDDAGSSVGIGSYLPKFGRFEVVGFTPNKTQKMSFAGAM